MVNTRWTRLFEIGNFCKACFPVTQLSSHRMHAENFNAAADIFSLLCFLPRSAFLSNSIHINDPVNLISRILMGGGKNNETANLT